MYKKLPVLLLLLALALGLTASQLAWADEGTVPPPEEVVEEPVEPAPPTPIDITPVLTAANATIDAMLVTEEVKARLRAMLAERLQEAVNRGFTLEQVQVLATQTLALVAQCNLGADLPHVNACFQLMIKAMRNGCPAEEVSAMISAKLTAGTPLKTALKQTRFELKVDQGQAEKKNGENKGKGPKGKGDEE